MQWHEAGSDRDRVYRALRANAASALGETRAAAIEATLKRTADSIWTLARLEFRNDEKPGFFLGDLPSATDEDARR